MTFQQVLPVTNRNGNGLKTAVSALDPNLGGVTLRIDCTSWNPAAPFTGFNPRPFNSPTQAITFLIEFSWDGGATFPGNAGGTQNGSASGIWATLRDGTPVMAPNVSVGVPFSASLGGRPTHYRGSIDITNGPIVFGVSAEPYDLNEVPL